MKSGKIFSLLERLGYRASNSFVALALAYISGPKELGLYAFGSIALTLILSLTDAPLRQYIAGVTLSGLLPGKFIRRIVTFGFAGSLALLLFISGLALVLPEPGISFFKLLPLVPVPLLTCFSMLYQAQFESQGDWKKIFKIQAVAVATGTFAAITLLRTLGAGAANIQTLVAEIVFLAGVSQFKRIPRSENLPKVLDAQISTPMLSSLFGWLQSQSDRLVLGLLAGVSQLGIYSLSLSFSRTIGDAISSGINNNLRSEVMGRTSSKISKDAVKSALNLGLRISMIQQLLLCSVVVPLVSLFFKEWNGVPQLICLMSFGLVTGSLSWTLSNFLVISGFGKLLLPWQVAAVIMSLLGGAFLSFSLEWGYMSLLVRDLLILYSRVRISSSLGLKLDKATYRYIAASFLVSITATALIMTL